MLCYGSDFTSAILNFILFNYCINIHLLFNLFAIRAKPLKNAQSMVVGHDMLDVPRRTHNTLYSSSHEQPFYINKWQSVTYGQGIYNSLLVCMNKI